MAAPRLSVIVLVYNAPHDRLERCVSSVLESTGVGTARIGEDPPAVLAEIVLADNGSFHPAGVADAVANECDGRHGVAVRAMGLGRNWGFAGGVNRAVTAADAQSELVFLLNDDAVVEPACLHECARVLADEAEECLGVAPKMFLASFSHHLDAVGNAVNRAGEAFNIGIGQLDVGQYDRVERCFGPCHGAALLRRRAFDPTMVGQLDESYFLYYEDVDWNWRANLFGYHFVTAPAAQVEHQGSASVRHLDYGFKFRLTERNLLITAAKNLGARSAAGIWHRRLRGLIRGSVTGHYPVPSLRAAVGALARLPRTVRVRRAVQKRRVRADDKIVAFSDGERAWFDPVAYAPERSLPAFAAAYRRRAAVDNEPRWLLVSQMAEALVPMAAREPDPGLVSSRLLPLLAGEPQEVLDEVRHLDAAAASTEA
jgi:GT2 family glycosyltransferase